MSVRVYIISSINSLLDKYVGIKIKSTRKPSSPENIGVSGMVDHFGRKNITGWVASTKLNTPIKVTLYLNDYPIHSTWANVKASLSSHGEVYSFYIGVRGIWDFCQKGDILTVCVNDIPLPISDKGMFKRPRGDATSSLEDLKDLLADGYIFNRRGDLQLSKKLDVQWQKKVIKLSTDVTELLKHKFKITPFLIYGSLLGQVREKNFIGHDDDFDMAYISKYKTGKRASQELVDVANFLRDKGFHVELRATALHIHDKEDPSLRIDLFHLYFNSDKKLCFPFGVAGKKPFKESDWNGVVEDYISGNKVYVPKNAKKMVECLYGSSWKVPIAGFNWSHARTSRDAEGNVPREVRDSFNNT